MNVFMYQAELYCEDCGELIRQQLTNAGDAPRDPDDEGSYDSDDFPKGPFPDGGGEADVPAHCGDCQLFLENPLTEEGRAYVVRQVIDRVRRPGSGDPEVLRAWLDFYNDEIDWKARVREYL